MRLIKRLTQGVLATGLVVLGLGFLQSVNAASTDTMNVLVTPGNISFGVQITSPMAGGYQFGIVNLGATTTSTSAITVANTGTVSEYFSMSISSSTPTSGAVKWAPVNTTPSTDQFELFANFVSTGSAAASFTNALLINTLGTASAALYNQGSLGKTPPTPTTGFQRSLWLKLIMPTDLSDPLGGAQTMVLSIDGQST